MKFDFETVTNRYNNRASKWLKCGIQKDEDMIVPMSVADMEFQTPTHIKKAIQDYVETEVLGYTHPTDDYYKTVVEFFEKEHNFIADKEWIITTPGVVPALATSVRAYTNPGDKIIIMPPVYPPFYEVIEGQGREISECCLIEKDEKYYIDFELLEKLSKDAKMLILCSPHNPTGRVWTKEELEKISEIVLKNDILLVSDEIHSDIMLTEKKHTVYGDISKEARDKSIICTAASKTFNIAGLQCSNIFISNDELREKFIKANLAVGIERANILGMVATRASYEIADEWIPALRNQIIENLKITEEFLDMHKDKLSYTKPEAGFLLWINFKNTSERHEVFIDLLNKNKIIVNDGKEYGKGGEYHIRMNLGLPKENLKRNLEILGNILA